MFSSDTLETSFTLFMAHLNLLFLLNINVKVKTLQSKSTKFLSSSSKWDGIFLEQIYLFFHNVLSPAQKKTSKHGGFYFAKLYKNGCLFPFKTNPSLQLHCKWYFSIVYFFRFISIIVVNIYNAKLCQGLVL